jgi:phosphoribosylformimino-5-aminoimidazole carboxamide ribonucleotide (ProFAR) isomerase
LIKMPVATKKSNNSLLLTDCTELGFSSGVVQNTEVVVVLVKQTIIPVKSYGGFQKWKQLKNLR